LRTALADGDVDYDGSQLRSGWLAAELDLAPDDEGALGAFLGACDVAPEHVVDLEERRSGEPIRAARMLHFIAEFPDRDLEKTVYRQRLLAANVLDELGARAPGRAFRRRGDDLFENGSKVTVSVATLSPRSSLFHFAVNVDSAGAPVPASGLEDFGIDSRRFAGAVLDRFAGEMEGARTATSKVRHVE
jgi:hypothetical protein